MQKEFNYNDELSISANVTEFINLLMPKDDQIRGLQNSQNHKLNVHQLGRVTASIFHHKCTRVNTLQKNPDEVTDSLF